MRTTAAAHLDSTHRPQAGVRAEAHRAREPWGWLAVVDLEACDRDSLADPEAIRAFVREVVPAIGMKAHGPLLLERFGEGDLEGWSAVQFIETSTVTIHADEVATRCFIDIISCKAFDADVAAKLAEDAFGGRSRVTVIERV